MDQGRSSPPAGIDVYKLSIVCVLMCLFSLIFIGIFKTFFYMGLYSVILALCDAARSPKSDNSSPQNKIKPIATVRPFSNPTKTIDSRHLRRGLHTLSGNQPLRLPQLLSFARQISPYNYNRQQQQPRFW